MSDTSPTLPAVRHHLDRRAHELIEDGAGDGDDLITSTELAEWFSVSIQWVEIARHKNLGPPWCALSARRIRYKRSAVLAWLEERTRCATAATGATGRKPGSKVVAGRVVAPEAADAAD